MVEFYVQLRRHTTDIKHIIVSSLVIVHPCQQFILENCHAAQPRSDAIFLPEPCYMLLSCTLKDLHPLLFIQIRADVLPSKCLRDECC